MDPSSMLTFYVSRGHTELKRGPRETLALGEDFSQQLP